MADTTEWYVLQMQLAEHLGEYGLLLPAGWYDQMSLGGWGEPERRREVLAIYRADCDPAKVRMVRRTETALAE